MAETAAANSPAPFQQMVKLRAETIRQGLLPPTAISGVHPNESHGDRLAREILNITHYGTPTGLQQLEVHSSPAVTNHQGRA